MTVEPTKDANLQAVSLAGLLEEDIDSVRDLLSACKENGFFYLDFRHESTSDVLKLVDDLSVIGKSVFKLPLEEKEIYSTENYLPSRLLGYVGIKIYLNELWTRKALNEIIITAVTSELAVLLDLFPARKMATRAFLYVHGPEDEAFVSRSMARLAMNGTDF